MVKTIGIGSDDSLERAIREEIEKIHVPSRLESITKTSLSKLKTSTKKWFNKPTQFVTIVGASGNEDIPETKIKIITDHYTPDTRRQLNDCILSDPLLSPATDRRFDSIFEDDFHLELEPAIAFDPITKTHLTKEQSDEKFKGLQLKLEAILQQLETWRKGINLLETMRSTAAVSFSQGRAAALISPGLLDLNQGALPFSVEIIHYSDLGEPVVDIGLTKQIVAVKTNFADKRMCRRDEIVYITRNKRGYRKEGKFYGTSPLEPILTISKSIKRIYNYDIPEAVVAAYITKILFTFTDGADETEVTTFLQNFLKTGKLAFGMTNVEKVDVVQPKVDVQMIDSLESKLYDTELSVVGVPKSMMNREQGLTRDIATIEAIQFIKFVRKPDEQLLADAFENQLFNPLLSIMSGMPLNQLPVRIKIIRNKPEKDLDTIFEKQEGLAVQKTNEINSENLKQDDAVSIFGASGDDQLVVTPDNKGGYYVKQSKGNSSGS